MILSSLLALGLAAAAPAPADAPPPQDAAHLHVAHPKAQVTDGSLADLVRALLEKSGRPYAVGPGLRERATGNLETLDWKRALDIVALLFDFHGSAAPEEKVVRIRSRTELDGPAVFPPPGAEAPPFVKVIQAPLTLNILDVVSAVRLAVPDAARVDAGPNGAVVYRGPAPGAALADAFVKKLSQAASLGGKPMCMPYEAAGKPNDPNAQPAQIYRTLGLKDATPTLCGAEKKAEVTLHGEPTSLHRVLGAILRASGRPFLVSPFVGGDLATRVTGPWDCVLKDLADDQRLKVLETPDGVLLVTMDDDRLLATVPPPPETPRICFFPITAGREMDKYQSAVRLALTRSGRLTLLRPLGVVVVRDTAAGMAAVEDVIKGIAAAEIRR